MTKQELQAQRDRLRGALYDLEGTTRHLITRMWKDGDVEAQEVHEALNEAKAALEEAQRA